MRRTSLKASVTIVIWPFVGRISIGYDATAIMRGMPYGTHATAPLAIGSPFAAASASAFRFASNGPAYCGFSTSGVAAGAARFGAAPRPPRGGAHTPARSTCADGGGARQAGANATAT